MKFWALAHGLKGVEKYNGSSIWPENLTSFGPQTV